MSDRLWLKKLKGRNRLRLGYTRLVSITIQSSIMEPILIGPCRTRLLYVRPRNSAITVFPEIFCLPLLVLKIQAVFPIRIYLNASPKKRSKRERRRSAGSWHSATLTWNLKAHYEKTKLFH
jgi:hypothetical protein